MTEDIKWTPEHFPRGTVIKTQLFRKGENGELIQHYSSKETDGVELTVDHIKVVPTSSGRNTLVVTTTRKDKPLYDGDDFIIFNISHVTEIVSIGKQTVVKYEYGDFKYQDHLRPELGKCVLSGFYIHSMLSHYLHQINPQKQFNTNAMFVTLLQRAIFKFVKSYDFKFNIRASNPTTFHEGGYYKFNKKKLKKWLKQNANRFIISEKQLKKNRDELDEILYKNLEDQFDCDYADRCNVSEKPIESKPIEDEEPRIEDYYMLSTDEKAVHDNMCGKN